MNDSDLSDTRDWTGEWWVPENPGHKVPGVLSYSPEHGLQLRLIGGWEYHVTWPGEGGSTIVSDELQAWPLVLGIGDGKLISLLGVRVASAKSYSLHGMFRAPDKLQLWVHTALVGAHMDESDEPAFIAASAHVEDLTAWSRRSGIRETHVFGHTLDKSGGRIELDYLEPLSVEVGPLTAKLSHFAWQPNSVPSRAQNLSRVREHQVIRFERDDPQPLEYWLDLLDGMADLMSLSTLHACGIISMQVNLPPTPEQWPADHPRRDQPHEVNVYKRRLVQPQPSDRALDIRRLVLTLDDLPFDQLIPKWLDVRDTFAAARSMILGLRYVQNGYTETRVVTAVAAAESLHRALEPPPPIPPAEFQAIRRTLLATISPERRSWLADKLTEHSNVPTLKQRLLELVERVGEPALRLVHDPAIWAKAAKNARNNLAHVGTTDNDLNQLHAVAEVTSAVVILNLLYELGVPEDRLTKAVAEHPVLSHSAKLARQVLCADNSIVTQIAALNVAVVKEGDTTAGPSD